MTMLTLDGLILQAPPEDPGFYLQILQLRNYDKYLENHGNSYESLAWLNFEAEDHE